jgi:hypothetical protein
MTLSDISVEMVLASLSLACDLSGMPPVPPSVADRLWNFGSNSWVENLEPEHELLNEQLFADYDKELSHADCRQWQKRNARL